VGPTSFSSYFTGTSERTWSEKATPSCLVWIATDQVWIRVGKINYPFSSKEIAGINLYSYLWVEIHTYTCWIYYFTYKNYIKIISLMSKA
jgi:hypothetical protein